MLVLTSSEGCTNLLFHVHNENALCRDKDGEMNYVHKGQRDFNLRNLKNKKLQNTTVCGRAILFSTRSKIDAYTSSFPLLHGTH